LTESDEAENSAPVEAREVHNLDTLGSQKQDPLVDEIASPGSLMGSSVQSHQLLSFDIDEASSTGGTSWRIGMPWFKKEVPTGPISAGLESASALEHNRYYGGLMKQAAGPNAKPPTTRRGKIHAAFTRFRDSTRRRISMGLSNDDESVSDFDESEWTPQDSAYGAACPVCGFIPKHVRRLIEFSLLAGMILGFVYLLVTTSIQINNDRVEAKTQNSTSTSDYRGGQLALDDDLYVAYNQNQNQNHDDDQAYVDVDDYSNQYYNDDGSNNDDATYNNYNYNDDDGVSYYGGGRGRKRRIRRRM
jgi:hypothetical protein